MNWLIDNWYIAAGIIGLLEVAIFSVLKFFDMPTDKQKEQVKNWLVWSCLEAEKSLQSGTGQLKLRQVYNSFCSIPAFTWIAKIISFELFSSWVSEALVEVKQMLINNKSLAEYVYGKDKAVQEVEKIKEQMGE